MISLLLPVALAAPAIAAPAQAPSPLAISSAVMVETKQAAPDGTTRIVLVPAKKVVPGDKVIYVLSYRNNGNQPLADIVFANPLPRELGYRAPAQGSVAPELSVDGKTYGPLAALQIKTPAGAMRPATTNDVTHLRWRLARPLTAGAQGKFAFQAVVN